MPKWLDIYHWSTPRDRFIRGRLTDGSECDIKWNPMRQAWTDRDGNDVIVEGWREIENGI